MELRKIRNPLHFFLTNKSGFKPKVNAGVKEKQFTAPMSGFIPVHLADSPLPALCEEKIEIRFPDGIQVILTGPASLSVAESLISRR
ncbi:MAG: hypothetical protein D4R64_12740 [Porphyromonadaceae bacterium]|nr:MAG: hypothetical protein D4R64_12740 [Porphyromonadaceae bacterium]